MNIIIKAKTQARNSPRLGFRVRSALLALLIGGSGTLLAGEDDHGLSDQLSAEAQALAPAFAPQAPAATVLVNRISQGEWASVIAWTPHIPVTAATLPDGRLLTFASNQRTTFPVGPEFTYAAVWNPATGVFTEINNTRHDMFCGGASMLPDGRVVINGGRNTTKLSSVFDWRTSQWTALPNMNDGRWYNTSVALTDGSVFTVTGDGGTNTAERWSSASGWARLTGINWATQVALPGYVTRWHPLVVVAPDGRLFHGGPTDQMNWLTATGTGSLTYSGVNVPGAHYPKEGCFAMYDEGRILVAGGSASTTPNASDSSTGTSTNLAFTIDIRTGTPVVAGAPSMTYKRQFGNSVILPSGEVLVIGGNTSGLKFNDTGAVLIPELWNPTTRLWRQLAPMSVPRNYHSLALLLPDGRVWSGGGGLSGNGADHQDGQLFTPPMLYNADGSLATRPVITQSPKYIGVGTTFAVQATPGVTKFSFIKMSSQTHAMNTDLRYLSLPFTETAPGVYTVKGHANLSVMTPGYWMLFGVSANGAYSVAKVIQVDPAQSVSVANPGSQFSAVNAPATLAVYGVAPGNGSVTYTATGLPTGLSINASTGVITGTPTATGTFSSARITVTDGITTASTTFAWTITPPNLSQNFASFTSAAGLQLNGSTSVSNGVLVLTPNAANLAGSAFLTAPVPVSEGTSFATRFVFRMNGTGDGADGMTFVLQGNAATALGAAGGGEAYEGILKSLAIELDTYAGGTDPNANHIGVLTNGVVSPHLSTATPTFDMENGSSHTLWVDYDGPSDTLCVYLVQGVSTTKPATPILTQTALKLANLVGPSAWIGFTGATGGSTNTHEVLAWQVNLNAFASPTPPVVTNPGTRSAVIHQATSLSIQATDANQDTLAFSASGLPPGLSINAASGIISGTPTAAGSFPVTVSVTDGNTAPASASFTWVISNGLTVQQPQSAPAGSGAAMTLTAASTGGANPRFRWNFGDGTAVTAYSTSASISHTFANPGRYTVIVTATDDTGAVVTSTFFQAVYAPLTARKPAVSSSLIFEDRATGNDRVWLVNPDTDSVSVLDAVTRAKLAETSVGTAPRSLALAPDGRVWVTNAGSSTISILNGITYAVATTLTLPRGSRPFGIAFDPNGSAAYVALEGSGRLLKLHPSTGAQIATLNAGQHARHVSISADGARVYVSRFITPSLPGENTVAPNTTGRGGEVLVITASTLALERTILLQHSEQADTPTSARGLPNYLGATAISPDGLSAWVPSKQDNIKRGTLRNGEGLNHDQSLRAIASRINLSTQAEDYAGRVDFDNAGMPSAAAFDPWGIYIFVALESSRAIAVVDAWNKTVITRFDAGLAPQGLAISPDGRTLFVHNFMSRTVSVHDVSSLMQGGSATPVTLGVVNTVTTEKLSATVLKGKQLFYDAADVRLALQEYISCASCHNDGGHDGRTWDFTGTGEGLRNTITLRGHGAHGALHWSGNFDEVHDFEGQIRVFSEGTGLMTDAQFNTGTRNQPLGDSKAGVSADLDALAAYVTSLTTESSSPNRNADGTMTTAAVAGERIFRQQNCASCHSGAAFTNSALNVFRDVGTITQPTSGKRLNGALTGFDVPTMRGLWATAPYLHDGSAATLADAVTAHQGVTLNATDLGNLVAYLQQIDDGPVSAPLPVTVELATTAPASVSAPFGVTATFSHAVTGFTVTDISVTGGTASALTGSGTSYSFTITPTANVTLSIAAAQAQDADMVTNLASNLLTSTYTPTASGPDFVSQDIGSGLVAGSTSTNISTGVHTLVASGQDIYFTADGFRFEQIVLNGNGEVRARVRSLVNTNPWAKAGVMVRETLAAGSRHATMFITPPDAGNGFGMVSRLTANGTTGYAGGPAMSTAPNNWVRLVREGNVLTGYASANGTTWVQVSTITLTNLSAQVYVGLAATSSDSDVATTAEFDNVQVIGAQTVVTPSVTLTAASGFETGPFTVQVQFSQSVTGLTLSDFTVSNATASNLSGSGAAYAITLTPSAAGVVTVSLPAGATQNAAAISSTASNTVSVTYTVPAAVALAGQDVGAPWVAGSTTFSGGVYTLKGSGSDIFFNADGFHYALTQLTGDGEIRARVTSQSNTNPWAKTGVMMREALTAGARHAMAFTTPAGENNGFGMVWRSTVNAAADYAGGPALNTAPNNWVRLVRSGTTISAYASANGNAWTLMNTATLTGLTNTLYVGLAVTSSSPPDLATSTFDNVQVVGAQAVVAPSVTLSAASSTEAGPFTVQAQFSQVVTGLALNDFVVTNATASNLTGSGTSYRVTLTPTATGAVTVKLPANAAQNAGAAGSTASNTVSVTYTPPVAVALQGQDVGPVQLAGSTAYNSATDTYTLRGAGDDIFFAADGFQFASTQLTGNGEIRARITSQTNTNPWCKTGVMIREALTGGARHAMVFTTPVGENNGFGMVWRSTVNAAADYAGGPPVNAAPNNWVRIVRTGDTLTSYASANGNVWTLIDSTTLTGLANVVRIGLAVTSSSPYDLALSTFDNVQIIQAAAAPAAAEVVKNVLGSSSTPTQTISVQSTPAQPISDADLDGDGVNDLIEYALGTDSSFDGGWWLTTTSDGRVDAHLNHPRSISGVSFLLESSTDLLTWTPLMLAPTATSAGSDLEQLTWSGITSLSTQNTQRGILRLRVNGNGTSAATTPQAWQRFTFAAGSQTSGIALVNAPLYAGRIEQLSGSSIILANAHEIHVDAATACYLEVLDGAQAGHRFEIASLTSGVATLASASPLNTLLTLPADLIGARVVLRPHMTLAQAFPVALFQAAAVADSADQVLFYENGTWNTHWLSARSGVRQWVSTNDTAQLSQNAKIIPPGIGLMVKATSQPKALTLTGHVRVNPWRKALSEGQNLLAMPWPMDATPQRLGLTSAAGFTASTNVASADQLQLWQADHVPGATAYDSYWLLNRLPTPYWTLKGSASLLNVNTTLPLPSHRAFFLKAQPSTSTHGWLLP
jgi:regulation of enolase protein 1 (concanavalin A-like superfamily)/mono/diheme cytochrome c family protein